MMGSQAAIRWLPAPLQAIPVVPGHRGGIGLARLRYLLDRLGQPERRYRSVHIAGTNGKGSTAAFLESILRRAGLRVGLYTSPHLRTANERIQVNRVPLDDEALAAVLRELRPILRQEPEPLTAFELLTLVALLSFARASVDVAVIEAGIGGRFDATNVLPSPAATVITSIDWDHVDRLGPTLQDIAWQKAGITKPGVPVYVGPLADEALAVVARSAAEEGAPFFPLGRVLPRPEQLTADLWCFGEPLGCLRLPLPGSHQGDNATLAQWVARQLAIPPKAIAEGLSTAVWPGRFQRLKGGRVVVDGAHNRAAMAQLGETLRQVYPGERFTLLFGSTRSPGEASAILQPLRDVMARLALVPADPDYGCSPDALCRHWPTAVPFAHLQEALSWADRFPERTVITGSLYLVGQALGLFRAC